MRKNFLLLFLMALLPLAGWAQAVDLSDHWEIVFNPVGPVNYNNTNQKPAVKLHNTNTDAYLTEGFNVSWDNDQVINAGSYTVTVTSNTIDTYDDLAQPTKKFWVLKAANAVENAPAVTAGPVDYSADGYDLVATAPVVSWGTVKYMVTDNATVPDANADGWLPSLSKVKIPGTYYVYYKVDEDANWAGIAPAALGTGSLTINGTAIPVAEYNVPTALGANIDFDNQPHALANAGSLAASHPHCTAIQYSLDNATWSTSVPEATNVDNYTVYYKIVGVEGYLDVTGNVAASIVAVAPEVTKATGKTGLVWTGEPQDLLSAAGSATLGATSSVKYQIKFGDGAYGDAVAYADVKGTAAGTYTIKTIVPAGGNYLAAEAAATTEVIIAGKPAFTSAPTAASLTWNNADQQLITEGEGTVAGIVEYQLNDGAWTTTIANIKASNAGAYTVKYRVTAANYAPVAETTIENVKINKKVLSVKANNVQKTYNGTANVDGDAAVVGGGDAFTFIGRVENTLDFTGVAYDAIDAANKTAGTHEGVLKATTASLEDVSTNYDYTIIPGNLIIDQKALTVTAHTGLNADYLADYNISNEYDITGLVGGETKADAFSTAPVLTTNAAASKPEPGTYTVSFTQGTLKAAGNYKMSNAGENEDGYVIGTANFIVNPDADSKIVITVLPKTGVYGDAEDWTNMVAGTDYYVTGLIGSDQLKTAPTFTRSDATNFNVGTYDLIASGATIDDAIAGRYPGGIVYNNSTFEITTRELVATVETQVVRVGDTAADIDGDAWSVEGLQLEDTKADLGGTLAISSTAAVTDAGTITLAITNTNYTLKTGTNVGTLIVISATTLGLEDKDETVVDEISAWGGVNDADVAISFERKQLVKDGEGTTKASFAWDQEQWQILVLPFGVTPKQLSEAFGYAIVNVVNPDKTTEGNVQFKLIMNGTIPANTPFLIKTADPITTDDAIAAHDNIIGFDDVDIVAPTSDYVEVNAGMGYKIVGCYKTKTLGGTEGSKAKWMANNEWNYLNDGTSFTAPICPFNGYIDLSAAGAGARDVVISIEDIDGTITAIKSVNVENNANQKLSPEGWYNLNGMKLQGAPTQKGVYIKDGKKFVIK